ncbi:MAG: nucleoside triphosphate pyrophosphohydrolase [Acidobacteria bacterium]|nr:nucleoside triphosphate pyrophosphohydrolase [Acidobacteriota bacterium]
MEFEPEGDQSGHTERIAVRQWRDGIQVTEFDLSCTSELQIALCLRRVALWATKLSERTHFEWIWDGKKVHIVQVDAAEPTTGVDPHALLPAHIAAVEVSSLRVFRPANEQDYGRFTKLRNAKLYRQLGYAMPVFYVADEPGVMSAILAGRIPPGLGGDLKELTARPLVIRTDGMSIPDDKREMLPRSEELRSSTQAEDWLLDFFKAEIEKIGVAGGQLCLIAHHFIPSVASAWARAEPGKRVVRIESLWGIPEGLYWYSHDTFELDTRSVKLDSDSPIEAVHYERWSRPRYKGTFIAPDNNGNWIAHEPKSPYDWRPSIRRSRWLFEIARTTRQVAELEKHPVSLMWFIDNHPEATEHQVLPWFHNKSELAGPPKAAPRRKLTSATDFSITSASDWERLRQSLQSGQRIERVVVKPVDPELIRNSEFARQLADLAASNNFVVELSGGVLSHAYYILQRHGARVECADLFGADEDVIEYNKLVRDKIPNVIQARGEHVETVRLVGDALVSALRKKLVEESFEALDAKSGEELVGELADVEEVIQGLCRALKVTDEQVESVRIEKRKRRGAFERGLMLTKTATPHSIQKQSVTPEPLLLELTTEQAPEPVISDETALPARPLYRRPDLRQLEKQLEKLFTFEKEIDAINGVRGVKATLNFSIPLEKQQEQAFTLTLEFHRIHSSLRGVVRLRPELSLSLHDIPDPQLEIEFPEKSKGK